MDKYVKENKDGKTIYRFSDPFGRGPGREVVSMFWELDSYIDYCLSPVYTCIKHIMKIERDEDSEIYKQLDVLERLYDSAFFQLMRMEEETQKHLGVVKIITTNEDHKGGFLQQDFLEVCVEKKQKEGMRNEN